MLFRDFWVLLLLAVLPLLWWRRRPVAPARVSTASLYEGAPVSVRLLVYRWVPVLWLAVLALLLLALARPQTPLAAQRVRRQGIDIVLALDVSGSMEAMDFKIGNDRHNRLHVVKQVTQEFIAARGEDRIGIVAFAGLPFIVCPLTLDQDWLNAQLDRVQIGMMEDGTAIGSAILTALNRLRQSTAQTKIIVLLTDGENNAGRVTPATAAESAAALNVKIYTIGVGSDGPVPFPVKDMFGRTVYQNVEIGFDEALLEQIAATTGGRYFRAGDTQSLKKIYRDIDRAEKTEFEQQQFNRYRELSPIFIAVALGLLAAVIILREFSAPAQV